MTWSIITSAFLLGIASNLHCVGMCGPIALAIPYNSVKTGWFNLKIIRVLLYNFGRISTYALLGLCAGLIANCKHLFRRVNYSFCMETFFT